jgi:hypothetical protein
MQTAETVMNAPGWVGGNYDAQVYGRPNEEWPSDLGQQNKLVFEHLGARPLADPEHARLKSSILAVAESSDLAQEGLSRVFGFGSKCRVEVTNANKIRFPNCRLLDCFRYTVATLNLYISWGSGEDFFVT